MTRSKKSQEVSEFINGAEQRIRSGDTGAVREMVGTFLAKRTLERRFVAPLAEIARRSGLAPHALRALNPIIRPRTGLASNASPDEIAEYAFCLVRVGANEEALSLIGGKAFENLPKAVFAKVSALVSQWEYRKTIPLVTHYLSLVKMNPYATAVALLNLAAAQIFERQFDAAKKNLDDAEAAIHSEGYVLLSGNLLELRSRLCFTEGDWQGVNAFGRQAASLYQDTNSLDHFLSQKWPLLSEFVRSPDTNHAKLQEFRREALQRKHWETVRDCDKYEACVRKDVSLALKLVFGTPYRAYRERITADFGDELPLPLAFTVTFSGPGKKVAKLDLSTPDVTKQIPGMKAFGQRHCLLRLFFRDLYRPLSNGNAYGLLFKGEYYNPMSSPQRVYQAVHRLRDSLAGADIPLTIQEEAGHYSITSSTTCQITLPLTSEPPDRETGWLSEMERHFGNRWFSVAEAATLIGVSDDTALRLVNRALAEKRLCKLKEGRQTRYQFESGKASLPFSRVA